jgi:hypothetical protein
MALRKCLNFNWTYFTDTRTEILKARFVVMRRSHGQSKLVSVSSHTRTGSGEVRLTRRIIRSWRKEDR